MWRQSDEREEIVVLGAGRRVDDPARDALQFRALGNEPLTAVAVTMPPWPDADEAVDVTGAWEPTV